VRVSLVSRRARVAAVAAVVVGGSAIAPALGAPAAERALVRWEAARASAAGVASVPPGASAAAAARYAASLDASALREMRPGDAARLALPRGVERRIRLLHTEVHPSGDTSWVAAVEGGDDGGQPVVLTLDAAGDAVSGVVRTGDGDFRIQSDASGTWLVDLGDPGLAPVVTGEDDALPPPVADARGIAGVAASLAQGLELPRPPRRLSVLDVLVVHTPGLRTRLGAGMRPRLETSIALTNQAFAASGVAARLRLVHVAEVGYSDRTSNAEALGQLTEGTHPALAGVREMRDLVGADLVVLVRPFDNAAHGGCGSGWIGGWGGVPIAFANGWAYSVVSDGDSQGLFCDDVSFAHELSHNLGCMHDRPTAAGQGGGQGAYAFGFGYGVPGRFGTLMSYVFPRLARFSNPDRSCAGLPCGVDEARADSANNALAIELVRAEVARFRPAAEIDPGFGDLGRVVEPFGTARAVAGGVAVAGDGRLVVAGAVERSGGGRAAVAVARFLADGTLDRSFSGDGIVEHEVAGARLRGEAVAVQPDGAIVVAATLEQDDGAALGVLRFTSGGALDAGFSRNGIITRRLAGRRLLARGVAIDGSGRIVVAGTSQGTGADAGRSWALLARLRPKGTLDASFRGGLFEETVPGGAGSIEALALDAAGRIVVSGAAPTEPGAARSRIVALRFGADGSLDTGFGDGGAALADLGGAAVANAVALGADGSVVAAGGWIPSESDAERLAVVRFTAAGDLDRAFGSRGAFKRRLGDGHARLEAVAVEPDGRIFAAGSFAGRAGDSGDLVALRLRRDGKLQRGFGSGGATATAFPGRIASARALAADAAGGIVVAGGAASGSASALALARYLP
jgi:uncharacterized delta-60 repeat protein